MRIFTSKVSIIGDNEAGKSEFIRRITGQPFKENYVPTIGADFTITELDAGDREIHLYLWDLNGHQSFSMLRKYYMHGSNVYIIVVDAGNPASFDYAAGWKAQGLQIRPGIVGMLVATKIDLVPDRAAAEKAIAGLASQLGLKAVLTSAKTGEGCVDALREIARLVDPSADTSKILIRIREPSPPFVLPSPLVVSGSGKDVSRRIACKVAIVGDNQAGKSTFVRRVLGAPFTDKYQPSCLFENAHKEVIVDDVAVALFIVDFYGHHLIREPRGHLMQRTGIAVVAVDMTSPGGLDGARTWRDEVLEVCPSAKAIIAGMKHDALQDVKISDEAFFAKAKELDMQPRLLSAKTGEGCDDLLADLARIAIAKSPPIRTAGPELLAR
jgi:small GTP-binding protein